MRPVKVIIPGQFWDCHIYRGRLYLWRIDGSLVVLHWDKMIDSLAANPSDRLALLCAFSRSDYLYNDQFPLMFEDADIVNVLRVKFDRIAACNLTIDSERFRKFTIGVQDNPFKGLSGDIEIYNNVIYAATDDGLWATTAHRSSRQYPVSSRPKKIVDFTPFSIRAHGQRLALAAGDEGLWEYPLESTVVQPELYQVTDKHSSVANWSFSSIYSSSYVEQGYMAAFEWEEGDLHERHRVYKGIVDQSAIFGGRGGFSWGTYEKLYRATKRELQVVRFEQGKLGQGEAFSGLGTIPFDDAKGSIIGGGIASFGVIVECDNAIVVLRSDNTLETIPGGVVRWRVYPRSLRFENHLHLIYEDRLEIHSFNHDFLVNQNDKVAGIAFWNPRTFRGHLRGFQ